MIVAKRKPFEEIARAAEPYRRVLVVGCGTCVAVCLAGGEKEAGILAAQLDIAGQLAGRRQSFEVACLERQCDAEFLQELAGRAEEADALLSLACGAGIQFLAERFPLTPVIAGVDTTMIGVNSQVGVWDERCRACHHCLLTTTGGFCPVALCPKGQANGPCGGAREGRCETDPERDCVWSLIWRRLEDTGRLHLLEETLPPRDFSPASLPAHQVHPAYQRRYTAHD
jgi:ferredoxin